MQEDARRVGRAFTLIELLVVIAIIAVLVSILLPALGGAREAGRMAVCLSNTRQMVIAGNLFANDNDDTLWPAFGWGRVGHLLDPDNPENSLFIPGMGLMYAYCENAEDVGECPANRRRGKAGVAYNNDGTQNFPDSGYAQFRDTTELSWDYTMVHRVEGATLGSTTRFAYLKNPGDFAVGARPGLNPDSSSLTNMSGVPVFVEESTYFNNFMVDGGEGDSGNAAFGLWGGARSSVVAGDQITTRHNGSGTMSFLEGHAKQFNAPQGSSEDIREAADFEADDVYITSKNGGWIPLERRKTSWGAPPFGYGWINAPF